MSRLTRRQMLQVLGAGAVAAVPTSVADAGIRRAGLAEGPMTGAEALVETLQSEGADWVFGIPGAQENELWDTFKSKHLGYTLVTHEFNAATMADGYARSTGKPGVLCVVPGPGLTNSLSVARRGPPRQRAASSPSSATPATAAHGRGVPGPLSRQRRPAAARHQVRDRGPHHRPDSRPRSGKR